MANRLMSGSALLFGLSFGLILASSPSALAGPRGGSSTGSRLCGLEGQGRPGARFAGDGSGRHAVPAKERAALIALYRSAGGEGWVDRTNWLGPEGTEGTWYGVVLDEAGDHVQGLFLGENNLAGTLPVEIGDLPYIQDLLLQGNHLTGSLPAELGNLSSVVRFIAWGNAFSGPLPPSLGQLSNLVELDFGGNSLTGCIPAEFAGLSSLDGLFLNDNALDGSLPQGLGQLAHLRRLTLQGNAFSGELPVQWAGLASLEVLWLAKNPLGGTLSSWLGGLTNLTDVDLSECGLTGTIPEELGSLTQLASLNLGDNQLIGPIPPSLGNLSRLEGLGLHNNSLTGFVPPELWGLTNLRTLSLAENRLGGSLMPEVGNLTELRYLFLQGCGFMGPLPVQLGSLPNLLYLQVERNGFWGPIPAELGSLATLQVLSLSGNKLSGEVPSSLLNLTSLEDGWGVELGYNALHTEEPALKAFLLTKGDDWEGSQTVAPPGLLVQGISGGTARLSWAPIPYNWDAGGYGVLSATSEGGPYSQVAATPDKSAISVDIGGLQPATTYYFKVQTFTLPHEMNPNTVESEFTSPIPFTTSTCALSCQASVSPAAGPAALHVQFQSLVTSGGCDGTPTLSWDFGDETTSADPAPTHVYRFTGWYEWTLRAEVAGHTCTTSGVIEAGVGVASGDVYLSVGQWDQLFVLDGPGVKNARATLVDSEGVSHGPYPFSEGHFALPELPTGEYQMSAALTYEDAIIQDALWETYGCPGPGVVEKTVTVPPRPIQLGGGYNRVDLVLPPPLVLLHGALECYRKWYSDDPSDPDQARHWDNAARAQGVIAFTPNYPGWASAVSWDIRAMAILDQVSQNSSRLRSGTSPAGPIPYILLGYDMGGLVARALTGGPRWDDPRVLRAQTVFLLGTPNSGSDYLLGGDGTTPMAQDAIMENFNEVYPDFGMAGVYACGGNGGWWNTAGGDGPVTLYSAFNISRVACTGSATGYRCTPYVWQSFDSGEGHIFPFSHGQLGGPASVQQILVESIIPQLLYYRSPFPESPAGGTIWGTGARTVGTAHSPALGRPSPSSGPQEFPFTISPSDGMGVVALVQEGSALFEVFDPLGALQAAQSLPEAAPDADGPGMEFMKVAPKTGTWTLLVTPGSQGAIFQAMMVENSAFDVYSYLGKQAYSPGETVQMHLDAEGDLTGVTFTSAEAVVQDTYGTEYTPVPLFDDGAHGDGAPGDGRFGGTLQAPDSPDSYRIAFRALGYYLDPAAVLQRTSESQLDVVRTEHLFTGGFFDQAADQNVNGRFDAIAFSAAFQAPAAGSFVARANLYDSNGYWVDFATAMVESPGGGATDVALLFDLSEATCDQFAGAFLLTDLELMDASTFETLDYWPDAILTQAYEAAGFECQQGTVGPRAYEVYPDQGAPGKTLDLLISGESFTDETSVVFSGNLALAGTPTRFSPYLLSIQVTIPAEAAPGFRSLTVANPGTLGKTLNQAFEVRPEGAPQVEIATPWDGDTVRGVVDVAASAWGDERVVRVTFSVDGVDAGSASSLPFQIRWDSASVSDGSHVLTALAESESGKTGASPEVTVTVANATLPGDCDADGQVSIGEVQRAINMFLGIASPACDADCNADGQVSIGEVQKVINAFLGDAAGCS